MPLGVMLLLCMLLSACGKSYVQQESLPLSELHLPPSSEDAADLHSDTETESSSTFMPDVLQQPTVSAFLVNLFVQNAPVKEVLFGLAKESGINMDIHPDLQGYVNLHVVQQSIPEILSRIARQVDMYVESVNGVWLVSPDYPVIRTYKLNYVNMSRDTSGFIGVASEINSTGKSNTAASMSGNSASGTVSSGNSNSSRTGVTSSARYHLWESVVQNIETLLEETEKPYGQQATERSTSRKLSATQRQDSLAEQTSEAGSLPKVITNNADVDIPSFHAEILFKKSRLIANPETGTLTVRATKRQHAQVKAYLQSVMRIATRQVLIEATIVEVELNKSFQMGIDWSRLSSTAQQRGWTLSQSLGNKPAMFNADTNTWETNNSKNALGQSNRNAAFLLGYFNPLTRLGSLSASVTLLEQFGKTRVLSSPKLMVLNNQTAILKVVDNLVYFTIASQISQSSSNSGANLQSVTTTANTVPVGLVMAVTAQINSQKRVNLNVRPTVSRVLRYIEDPNPQLGTGSSRIVSSIPEIQIREMESVMNVTSGHIAVLGGLMQEDRRDLTDRVPGLASLPVIGNAFTGKNQASKKTELIVFLRPTVIHQADVKSGDLQSFQPLLPEASPAEEERNWPEDGRGIQGEAS